MPADEFPEDSLDRIITAIETIEESLRSLPSNVPSAGRHISWIRNPGYRRAPVRKDDRNRTRRWQRSREIRTGDTPDSNPDTMVALGAIGAVSADTAAEMTRAARFRNVPSHTYGDVIDHDVVYNALQDLDRYRTFVHEIRDYLDEIGALD